MELPVDPLPGETTGLCTFASFNTPWRRRSSSAESRRGVSLALAEIEGLDQAGALNDDRSARSPPSCGPAFGERISPLT